MSHADKIRSIQPQIGREVAELLKELTGQHTAFALVMLPKPETGERTRAEAVLLSNFNPPDALIKILEELVQDAKKQMGH